MARPVTAGFNAGVTASALAPAPAPALCLLNPHAANGRCAALAAPLREALPQVPLVLPPDVASARQQLLALPEGSRVLVAGGDGTVHQLLPALVERRLQLALLPGGTGNDLARALGLAHLGWRDALAHAQRAPATAMDLGELTTPASGPRLFMSSLTAGFDAAIAIRALASPPGCAASRATSGPRSRRSAACGCTHCASRPTARCCTRGPCSSPPA